MRNFRDMVSCCWLFFSIQIFIYPRRNSQRNVFHLFWYCFTALLALNFKDRVFIYLESIHCHVLFVWKILLCVDFSFFLLTMSTFKYGLAFTFTLILQLTLYTTFMLRMVRDTLLLVLWTLIIIATFFFSNGTFWTVRRLTGFPRQNVRHFNGKKTIKLL